MFLNTSGAREVRNDERWFRKCQQRISIFAYTVELHNPLDRDRRLYTNPTHGSGWMVSSPTYQSTRFWKVIPPTAVGGWFKSSLQTRAPKILRFRGSQPKASHRSPRKA